MGQQKVSYFSPIHGLAFLTGSRTEPLILRGYWRLVHGPNVTGVLTAPVRVGASQGDLAFGHPVRVPRCKRLWSETDLAF